MASGTLDVHAQLRATAVNQVLGTDMKKHFDITSRFQVGTWLMHCIFTFTVAGIAECPHAQLPHTSVLLFTAVHCNQVLHIN